MAVDGQKIITIPEGKIMDYIDGKLRNDTAEEYVRQNIEKRLVNEHNYLINQIKVEETIKMGSKRPRVDLAIYPEGTPHKQENIEIIIECKREKVSPSNKKDGVEQLRSYMSACSNCEWGMWTNGQYKSVYRKALNDRGKFEYIEYNDIPSKDGDIKDIDRPKRNNLKRAVEHNLLFTFKACHNHIYAIDGMQKQPAFFELLKVIFCKIEDEQNIPHELQFYAKSSERSNPDGQLTVEKRITKIFDRVKKKHNKIFSQSDEIRLSSRSLSYIVSELQKYSLLDTHIDIKGKAYEEIVGANLRGDRGEFFTPRNVMHMVVDMISPKADEKVLDPACGTGGFLVTAMNEVIRQLKMKMKIEFNKKEGDWSYKEHSIVDNKISEIASNNFFGFDINPDLVKASKMNMVMNNDGSGNILRTNSLLHPHEWRGDFKEQLANKFGINKSEINKSTSLGHFDVIVTNPPFGSKIPIKDPSILEQYDLAYIWDNNDGNWKKTDRLQSSVPPEQLFIERCVQFLKPKGRMAIVLPDSILGSPGLEYIRAWIIRNTRILASIDLHEDTFQPRNGTQTSILFLQKKSKNDIDKEEKRRQIIDYSIFMAMVEKIGHDKRGNPIFKRDKYGEEILVPENTDIINLTSRSDGIKTVKKQSKNKMLDDQTLLVAEIFNKWRKKNGIVW